eukprot:5185595-Alexandrium_andersonii.AAC.1
MHARLRKHAWVHERAAKDSNGYNYRQHMSSPARSLPHSFRPGSAATSPHKWSTASEADPGARQP